MPKATNCTDAVLENFISSLVGEEGFSEDCCSDITPYVLSKSTATAEKYSDDASKTKSYRGSLYSKTFENSMEDRGEKSRISSVPDSLASRFLQRVNKLGKLTRETFGLKPSESFAKWDRKSRFWKTCQGLLPLTISAQSLATWRTQGTMRNGVLYRRLPLVPHTSVRGCGLWLGTPTTSERNRSEEWKKGRTPTLREFVRVPTPVAYDATPGGPNNHYKGLGHQAKHGRVPTPQASDCRDRGNLTMPCIQKRLREGKQLNLSMVVSPESGSLNPQWVEWLMDFPINWTALEPLEMLKFQAWLQQHF